MSVSVSQKITHDFSIYLARSSVCPSVRIGSVRYDLVDDHKDLPSQAIVDKLTPAEFHDTNRNSEILRDYMELLRQY